MSHKRCSAFHGIGQYPIKLYSNINLLGTIICTEISDYAQTMTEIYTLNFHCHPPNWIDVPQKLISNKMAGFRRN